MLAVGKHLGLMRQVGAAGIDEIDAGQPVLARDLLRAQMLLHGHRIIGAALDRRIVGDDHRLASLDGADSRDHAGAVHVALVHAERRERRDFEERRTGIDEARHALARQQLAAPDMALAGARRAALRRQRAPLGKLGEQRPPGVGVGVLLGRRVRRIAFQDRHGVLQRQNVSAPRCGAERQTRRPDRANDI